MTTALAPATPSRIIIRLPQLAAEIEIPQAWLKDRAELMGTASAITTVNNAKTFEDASWIMAKVTKLASMLETHRKALSKPLRDAADTIKEAADAAAQPLLVEKARLQALLGAYAEQERKRAADEAKKIEAEQRRQIEEQLAKKQAEADLGMDDEQVFAPEVTAPAPTVVPPKAAGVRTVERLAYLVDDLDKVPRGFLTLDTSAVLAHQRQHAEFIKQQIKDGKGSDLIPGLTFRIETDVVAR